MTSTVQAIYEHGVFRPLTPLALSEGQQVQVLIVSEPRVGSQPAASLLAQIAALPVFPLQRAAEAFALNAAYQDNVVKVIIES
jgi:predicted DNA-binding antitoxin AbrB/MazE fold protein